VDSATVLLCLQLNVILGVPNSPGARRGPVGGMLRAPDGTGRVMSQERKRICSEVYDVNLASRGGPSARTIVT